MEKIENNITLINSRLSELLVGTSFDKFCYAGIYTMVFTLNKPLYGFDFCNLDIATEITIKPVSGPTDANKFTCADFHLIWGKSIKKVTLSENLFLNLYFENSYLCSISSYIKDPEGLFDMRWSIYQQKEEESVSVWVSDEKNI